MSGPPQLNNGQFEPWRQARQGAGAMSGPPQTKSPEK
jgi:hypothetical protein